MAGDPYFRYGMFEKDGGSSVPSYLPAEVPSLTSHLLRSTDKPQATSEFIRNDLLQPRTGGYILDDLKGTAIHGASAHAGFHPGAVARGYSPLEDPVLPRRDATLGIKTGITDIERHEPLRRSESHLVDESNVLFVDGLPRDCTRREVAHLFRPFIGFKEIRVIHKEPRRAGEKGHVLCFVEFDDPKYAQTALQALQGYKFDEKKPEAALIIHFAKFPFRLPQSDQRYGITR